MTPKRTSIISSLSALGICIGLCLYMFYGLDIDPICWIYSLIISAIGYVLIIDGCKSHIFVPIIGGVHILLWVLLLHFGMPYDSSLAEFALGGILNILGLFHLIVCVAYFSWSRIYVYLKRRKKSKNIPSDASHAEEMAWYDGLKK